LSLVPAQEHCHHKPHVELLEYGGLLHVSYAIRNSHSTGASYP
jgi:hypothetical protein